MKSLRNAKYMIPEGFIQSSYLLTICLLSWLRSLVGRMLIRSFKVLMKQGADSKSLMFVVLRFPILADLSLSHLEIHIFKDPISFFKVTKGVLDILGINLIGGFGLIIDLTLESTQTLVLRSNSSTLCSTGDNLVLFVDELSIKLQQVLEKYLSTKWIWRSLIPLKF